LSVNRFVAVTTALPVGEQIHGMLDTAVAAV